MFRDVLKKPISTKRGEQVYLSISSINFSASFSAALLLYLLRVPWFTTPHNLSQSLIFFTLINESTHSQSVLYLISLHPTKSLLSCLLFILLLATACERIQRFMDCFIGSRMASSISSWLQTLPLNYESLLRLEVAYISRVFRYVSLPTPPPPSPLSTLLQRAQMFQQDTYNTAWDLNKTFGKRAQQSPEVIKPYLADFCVRKWKV